MGFMERIGGAEGIKIIVGSGFFWAWMDGLFMSAFFLTGQSQGFMSELAFIMVFVCTVPISLWALMCRTQFSAALASRRFMVGMALAGSLGSFSFIAASAFGTVSLIVFGGLLCGCFTAVFAAGWGACYCARGVQSAAPYVTGAFAFAPLVDIPLLLMIPRASSVFFALLPCAACYLFLLVRPSDKTYESERKSAERSFPKGSDFVRRYLGIPPMLLGAAMLVTFGFGYLQHFISFSPIMEGGVLGGIVIQLARGVASILIFALFLVLPQKMSVVYRLGFLVMVAGVMMMPFFFTEGLFAAPGSLIIAGYTVFDVFIWVVFCQMAQEKSEDPLKTIVFIRLIASLFSAMGAIAGILLVGMGGALDGFASQVTTLVGYLIVIAIVLILSGEDSRDLFASAEAPRMQPVFAASDAPSGEGLLAAWFEKSGLTAREKEIAGLLAQGYTQLWIAESLKISENTVSTHVRHIYQKTDIHDRNQFIERALCFISPKSRESEDSLTESA